MNSQKRPKIPLGDPDDSADAVHDEVPGIDPSAHATSADVQTLRDFGDCEKLDPVIAVSPSRDIESQIARVCTGPPAG